MCLSDKHDMWFLFHRGQKNKYFLQLNFNTGCFSSPPRNTSCCHKPKCSYNHSGLPRALPWEYRLPDTCGSEDAEAPALLLATLSHLWIWTVMDLHHPGAAAHPPPPLRGYLLPPALEGQATCFSAFGISFLFHLAVETPARVGLVCENRDNFVNASSEIYRVLIL